MLGSTQKLNDVYKAVRTNMPLKILLQLGEEVMTLDKAYNFSPRQKEQLTSFNVGWGMLVKDGGEHWPINWRGARCGLGLGDEHWRDRYAVAWGAHVFKGRGSGWISEHKDKDAYVNTRTGTSNRSTRTPATSRTTVSGTCSSTKSGTPFPSP